MYISLQYLITISTFEGLMQKNVCMYIFYFINELIYQYVFTPAVNIGISTTNQVIRQVLSLSSFTLAWLF